MLETIIQKIRGILFDPVVTFRNCQTDEPRSVVSYFGVLLLVYAGMIAAIHMMLKLVLFLLSGGSANTQVMPPGIPEEMALAMVFIWPLGEFLIILICGSVLILLFSLWTHLWVYLLGGRKGFIQTLHAILYSTTPNLLLGWIPLVDMVMSLWSVILMFIGIRELQEISEGRAAAVIFFAVILPLIIIAIVAVLAIIYLALSGGAFTPWSSIQ